MSGHLRGNLFFLRSWLHSCTKLSHLCRLTQAPGGSPDSSAGCWCQGVSLTATGQQCPPREPNCGRTDATGEKSEHFSLLLPLLLLTALDMWENYKPTCCVILFFFPSPTRSAATELVRDISSSSLLPWMKRVSINWLLMRKTRV